MHAKPTFALKSTYCMDAKPTFALKRTYCMDAKPSLTMSVHVKRNPKPAMAKNIHVAICRFKTEASHLTAHPIHADAHVTRMLRHLDSVILI